jgi:hypothetical protein
MKSNKKMGMKRVFQLTGFFSSGGYLFNQKTNGLRLGPLTTWEIEADNLKDAISIAKSTSEGFILKSYRELIILSGAQLEVVHKIKRKKVK